MQQDAIDSVVRLVHSTGLAPERWPQVLSEMRRLFDARGAVLCLRELHTGRPLVLSQAGFDEDCWRDYAVNYRHLDIWGVGARGLRVGEVATGDELIARAGATATFEQSRFYREFLVPNRMEQLLNGRAARTGNNVAVLALYRSRSAAPFDEDDRALLRLFLPHVNRAGALTVLMTPILDGDTAADLALEASPRGIVFLDERGVAIYANPAAEHIFRSRDGMMLRDGRPRSRDRAADREIDHLVHGAVLTGLGAGLEPGGMVRVPRTSGRRPYRVHVMPVVASPAAWSPLGLDAGASPAAVVILSDLMQNQRTPDEVMRALQMISPAGATLNKRLGRRRRSPSQTDSRPSRWERLRDLFLSGDVRLQDDMARLLDRPPPRSGNGDFDRTA